MATVDPKIQAELDAIALETAQLNLQEAREGNARRIAMRAVKERNNAQRQSQLRIETNGRRMLAKNCSHRQAGTPAKPYKGKGPTALRVQKMPDGFTLRLCCEICRMVHFSPYPPNQSKKPRRLVKLNRMETAEEVKVRVAKYWTDKAAFDELVEKSTEGLTEDSTRPMDCGTTLTITNEDGNQVFRPRPSDSYSVQFHAAA